jgi:neopullulanase
MSTVTPDWVRDAVFYQIFPDRFRRSGRVAPPGPLEAWDAPPTRHGFKGGDLYGVAERLDDLSEIGVTALYLTPVFASASNHRYHTYDYLAVDPLLGGNGALRELLDRAHERGMRVVIDGVFNHTGRGFWPFHHILENGTQSPYRTWFHLDDAVLRGERSLNAYPDRGEAEGGNGLGYLAWWDLPALPKLNTDDPAVRAYLFGVAEYWIGFGVDGWRLDVPEEIADPSFWTEFRSRVKAIDPDAYLVGEIWHEAHDWLAGDRFDAVMDYPLAEATLSFVAGERIDRAVIAFHDEYSRHVRPMDGAAFGRELERILGLYDPAVTAVQLNLIDSHDTPRFVTMAGGDRDALRLAAFLQATLPGAPCIYYGDEVGMEGGRDPDNRRAYPDDPAGRDLELRAFYRDVFAARRSYPALRASGVRMLAAEGGSIALLRSGAGEPVVVALTADEADATLDLHVPELAGRRLTGHRVAGWTAPVAVDVAADGRLRLGVPGRQGVLLAAASPPS